MSAEHPAPPRLFQRQRGRRLSGSDQLAGWQGNGRRAVLQGFWTIPGGRWVQIVYLLTDIFFVVLNSVGVFYLRFSPAAFLRLIPHERATFAGAPSLEQYGTVLVIYVAFLLFTFEYYELYRTSRTKTSLEEVLTVCEALILVNLLLAACMYMLQIHSVSRFVIGVSGLLNMICLAGWRFWKRQVVNGRIARGEGVRNILIVSAGQSGQQVAQVVTENKHLGYVVRGFVNESGTGGPKVLGKIEDLAQVAQANFVDEIFIALPLARERVKQVALAAYCNRLDVRLIPDLYDGLVLGVPFEHLDEVPVLTLHQEPIPSVALLVKKVLDVVISSIALILASPLMAAIAIAIKLDSPGPVLYRSLRVGKKGRNFVCYKFRTMVANADALKEQLRSLNQREGPFFKLADDPRLTRFGKWLRRYSVDELPQLWNVLRGEMSLVGPRPHPLDDYARYNVSHLRRLSVTPGMTGLWQVTARQDPSFAKNMALDLEYIEKWSPWMDIQILLKTVPAVFRGAGQ